MHTDLYDSLDCSWTSPTFTNRFSIKYTLQRGYLGTSYLKTEPFLRYLVSSKLQRYACNWNQSCWEIFEDQINIFTMMPLKQCIDTNGVDFHVKRYYKLTNWYTPQSFVVAQILGIKLSLFHHEIRWRQRSRVVDIFLSTH